MAKIELNIVALGDFSAVNAQIKALQVQVDSLNKGVAGVGLGSTLTKDLANAQAAFKSTMLSTGQFTMQTVKMASETEKFGRALTSGKLKLSEYFNIITGKAGQATASMNALAESQIRLQNSVVVRNKNGFLDVYTPTAFNKVAQAEELVAMKAMVMQKAIDGGSMALINFGKNTQWAGRQLTVGLTMPMVLFGAAAVKSFKETNIELTRLQRLYGEGLTPPSQTQINQISSQVLKLGTTIAQTMGIAQTETVKAAANFAAMGREGQNLIDTTAQTMRLSKLGAVSTADATNTVVALQNVYKVSTNDLATAVNFLSDIQKQTTMTLNDMTQAIPRVGPIMQQLGGTYKDTAVMLVAMRESGIPAAQAANAIKSAMASIIAPTSAATREFAKFGINLDSIKNAGGPVQMIEQLQAGLSKLSPLVREQLIEKLFGKFQFARVSALIENFGKAGSQTVNALKIAGATSNQLAVLANQEMKQATESTTAKWQRSLEGFKATLYPIGQKFLEMGTIILNVANKIGHAFSSLPSPLKGFFGFLAIGAALAGPLIMLTGLLSNFAGYLLKAGGFILKLANGGMSLKELLTPEIIASQKAAELFSNQIVNDVDAVDLLNQAIERLTISLSEMSGAMVTGTGDVATKVAAANALNIKPGKEMYGAMSGAEYRYLSSMGLAGTNTLYKSGTSIGQKPKFLNVPENEAIYAKPTTGIFAKTDTGVSNTALTGAGVEPRAYLAAAAGATGADVLSKEYATKYKTSTSLFLDALTKQTVTLENGTKVQLLNDEKANMLKAQLNKELETQVLGLEKINDINNPLAAVEKQILAKLEEEGMLIGLSIEQTRELINQIRFGMSNVHDINAAGGAGAWLGGGNTGLSRFKLDFTGLKSQNIEFWHAFNAEAKAAWEAVLVDMRGAGAQIIEYQGELGKDAALKFTESEIEMLRKLNPELLSQSVILEEEVGKARADMAAASGKLVAKIFSESEIATLKQVYPSILTATVLNEEEIANAKIAIQESTLAKEKIIAEEEIAVRSGMLGRLGGRLGVGTGKPSGMGAMGIAMAGMMIGMPMSSSKNQAVSTAGSGIMMGANAAMIASFLPIAPELIIPIALAVGGLTVAYKALSKVMADQKAHNDAIEASFKSSSSVISAYGGTMITAKQAVYNFIDANKESKDVLSKTAQDVAEIKKLGTSDPLKQVGELLKGGTTASGVIGTLNQFAAAQVANGMDPKAVSQMVTDLLTYSGQTKYLNQALKEITNNTKDMSTATATMINKLKNNGDANLITATTYKDLSKAQKAFADGLLTTTNIISDQATPFQVAADKIKALRDTSDNSIGSVNALALALKNAGASAETLTAMANLAKIGVTNLGEISTILMLNAAGIKVNTTDATKTTKDVTNGIVEYVKQKQKALIAADKDALKIEENKVVAAKKAAETAAKTATTKQLKNEQAALGIEGAKQYETDQKQVKVLEAQLATLKLQTSELQKQQQYQLNQQDLENQAKQAEMSGNYLQAAMLNQQKAYNTSQYNQNNSQDELQKELDNLKQSLADRALLIQNETDSTSSSTVDTSGVILAKQKLKDDKLIGTQLASEMTTLLADSGLTGFKAMVDGKGNYIITTTGNVNVNGTSERTLGSASNPISLSGNIANDEKVGRSPSSDLTQWNSPLGNTRSVVHQYANDNKITKNQYFSIDQYNVHYVFYEDADGNITMISADGAYNGPNTILRLPKNANVTKAKAVKKATGGHISGPGTGTSDSIPAYLSNGEYVIKADAVSHYGPSFFDSVNAKKFANGGEVTKNGWLQKWAKSLTGMPAAEMFGTASILRKFAGLGKPGDNLATALFPLNFMGMGGGKSLFLGMPRGVKDLEEALKAEKIMQDIHASIQASNFKSLPITKLGEQLEATVGKSFPVSGIGGLYKGANGTKEFVKPVTDALSGLSEIRSNQIARDVQGLDTPIQELIKIMDPSDPKGKRTLLALRSAFNPEFANPTGKFTKDQYFRQLVSSLLRGDKDLQIANLSGNNLVDAGTSGVFNLASGIRTLSKSMPSMQEQATINLLGVKGGAKRFFAESTASIAKSMTPKEYHDAIVAEIKREIPLLEKTIASFKLTDPDEIEAYANMLERLKAGAKPGVDWSSFQTMAASVVPAPPKTPTAAALAKKAEELTLKKRQSGHAVGFSDIMFKDQLGGYANGGAVNSMSKNGWLQKYSKSLDKSGPDIMGTHALIRLLAGLSNGKSDFLSAALIPLNFTGIGRGLKGAKIGAEVAAEIGAKIGAEVDASKLSKYFLHASSDGDITGIDTIMSTMTYKGDRTIAGWSRLAHDPLGDGSKLFSMGNLYDNMGTRDLLALSLMQAAKESGFTKTGINLAASPDRSIFSQAMVSSLKKRGLGNVIGLPELEAQSVGNTAIEAQSWFFKELSSMNRNNSLLSDASPISNVSLDAARKALHQIFMKEYNQKEFASLLKTYVKGHALGGQVKLPSFAVGTNFVPNDMIAQIHKGERIIPASQNNGTMDGSTYNISVLVNNKDANEIANVIMDKIKSVNAGAPSIAKATTNGKPVLVSNAPQYN